MPDSGCRIGSVPFNIRIDLGQPVVSNQFRNYLMLIFFPLIPRMTTIPVMTHKQ
jgi:hypothetical protein